MKKTVLILSSVFALSLSATTNNVETQQVANKVVVSSTSVDNLDMVAKSKKVGTNLSKSKKVGTNLSKSKKVGTNLSKSKKVGTNLSKSKKVGQIN